MLGVHEVARAFLLDAFDAGGRGEAERQVGGSEDMTGHVADGSTAEVIEAAPVEGLIEIAAELVGVAIAAARVGAGFGRSEPEVPIEGGGDGRGWRNGSEPLRPERAVGPGVDFSHVADLTGPNHFGGLAGALIRVALIAHLGGDFVLVGRFAEHARFPDGAGEGFLDVDMLAALHAPVGGDGVHEIGDGDDDRVDIAALLVEHFAEIFVLGRALIFLIGAGGLFVIDVAKGDDVFVRAAGDIAPRFAARPDRGDVEFLVR